MFSQKNLLIKIKAIEQVTNQYFKNNTNIVLSILLCIDSNSKRHCNIFQSLKEKHFFKKLSQYPLRNQFGGLY